MKQRLIWSNLQRDETWSGLSNIKDTFAGSLQLQVSVIHQSMCIFNAGVSQVRMMAGQNIKKKYRMCQISIKILGQNVILSLHNLKIHSSKGCRKTNQRWIICMYLTQ